MIARPRQADTTVHVAARHQPPVDERSMLVLERIVAFVALAAAGALLVVR